LRRPLLAASSRRRWRRRRRRRRPNLRRSQQIKLTKLAPPELFSPGYCFTFNERPKWLNEKLAIRRINLVHRPSLRARKQKQWRRLRQEGKRRRRRRRRRQQQQQWSRRPIPSGSFSQPVCPKARLARQDLARSFYLAAWLTEKRPQSASLSAQKNGRQQGQGEQRGTGKQTTPITTTAGGAPMNHAGRATCARGLWFSGSEWRVGGRLIE